MRGGAGGGAGTARGRPGDVGARASTRARHALVGYRIADEASSAVHVREALHAAVGRPIAEGSPRGTVDIRGAFDALPRRRVADPQRVARPAVGGRLAANANPPRFAATRRRVGTAAPVGTRKDALLGGRLADSAGRAVVVDAALNAAMKCKIATRKARLRALEAVRAGDALPQHAVAVKGRQNAVFVASADEGRVRRGRFGIGRRVGRGVVAGVDWALVAYVALAGVTAVRARSVGGVEGPLLRAATGERGESGESGERGDGAQRGRAARHGTALEMASASACAKPLG